MSHEEEMKKLMANHDELEARVRCLQGNEHSAHTINECTQSQSHPHQTNNTLDDNNISHEHRQTQDGRILCQISKDSSNPRSVPGELKRISKGLSNPRSTLGEPRWISKGFSNPRFVLGEPRENQGRVCLWSILQRFVKPKVYPWWVSPKPRMGASLVDPPNTHLMQSYPQGHWIEDSKKIGPEMQQKALGFSWALG